MYVNKLYSIGSMYTQCVYMYMYVSSVMFADDVYFHMDTGDFNDDTGDGVCMCGVVSTGSKYFCKCGYCKCVWKYVCISVCVHV